VIDMGLFKVRFDKGKDKVPLPPSGGAKQGLAPGVAAQNASMQVPCGGVQTAGSSAQTDLSFLNRKPELFPLMKDMLPIDEVELQASIKAIEKELMTMNVEQENLVGESDKVIEQLNEQIAKMDTVLKQYVRLATLIDRKLYPQLKFVYEKCVTIRDYHLKNKQRYERLPQEIADLDKPVEKEENDSPKRPGKD
jgi:hypothetical protein